MNSEILVFDKERDMKAGKLFRLVMVSAVLLLMMLETGCVFRGGRDKSSSLDLQEINKRIEKKGAGSAVLEAETADAEKRVKVREITHSLSAKDHIVPAEIAGDLAVSSASRKTGEATDTLTDDGVLFNFDNADIYEVIQLVADVLDFNYLIDPQVKGVVNIRSGLKISRDNLMPVFRKLLHMNGLDMRSEGSYQYIYKSKQTSADRVAGQEQTGELVNSSRLITQVVNVAHLPVNQAVTLLEPYLSAQGSIVDLLEPNILIINDYESKVIDALLILNKLDIAPLASLKVKLVRVDNAPLFDLRDELIEVLEALKVNKKDFKPVKVVALERINSLLLVGGDADLLAVTEGWVGELDVVPTIDRDNIYIYNVRNSVASQLAELVNSLITEEKPKSSKKKITSKSDDKKDDKKTASKKVAKTKKTLSTLRFVGQPVLFADDDRNIILIRALGPDYSRLVKLLERLDNLPRQVLVEVIVAEVSLTDSLELGVEWALHNNDLKINTSEYTQQFSSGMTFGDDGSLVGGLASSIGGGFTYNVLSGVDQRALLSTLVSETDTTIISSPQVLVLNNETATVNVGDQVPIVTSETNNSSEPTTTVDKTIQYKDTGVILEVTPQINYNGIILLDIKQTVSNAVATTTGVESSATIQSREVETKLAVKDGQSIMIGGMIKKDEGVTESGIPLLKDIPLLGYFFKYERDSTTKTELLIMVTPYVIETEDVLDQYVREFGNKMNELRREINPPQQTKSSISAE